MKKNNLFFKTLCMLSMVGVLFVSCESDTPEAEKAPEIPPVTTFMADLSFPIQEGGSNGRFHGDGEHSHWGVAATNVVVWQTILTVNLAIPVVAFKESFNHDVEYLADEKKWRWSYSFDHGGHTYEANLYGKLDGDYSKWEMYVSKSDAFENFLWYSGKSALDESHGSWTVYGHPEKGAQTALLDIDWNRKSEEVADIKYTSIEAGGDLEGSYIHYGTTDEGDYPTFYDIYLKSEDNLVEIDYDPATKQGMVISNKYFGDDNIRCWNKELKNMECN